MGDYLYEIPRSRTLVSATSGLCKQGGFAVVIT